VVLIHENGCRLVADVFKTYYVGDLVCCRTRDSEWLPHNFHA